MSAYSHYVTGHTFPDGGELWVWTAYGPDRPSDRNPRYVRCIGSGTAATAAEAREAAQNYINTIAKGATS